MPITACPPYETLTGGQAINFYNDGLTNLINYLPSQTSDR